jgi:hypothetical protein
MKATDPAAVHLFKSVKKVWSVIGYDVLEGAAAYGAEIDNESAIEFCIDAQILLTYADRAAQDALEKVCDAKGCNKAIKWIAKYVQLN